MSFFNKIKSALSKTSVNISKLTEIFTKKGVTLDTLETLEESLLKADFGFAITSQILQELKQIKLTKGQHQDHFRDYLTSIIADILQNSQKSIEFAEDKLSVILFCGVNGNGKTTSIGKLANIYKEKGKKVLIAACDTFRSAAVEQLKIWSERAKCDIVFGKENIDPASVAFEATEKAIKENYDFLMIDTAGRLQNQHNLMEELVKIIKVIKKLNPSFPTYTLLTLDATTGQNAINQVDKFMEYATVTGLIFTKLDGTAKGGAIVNISVKYKLPIYYLSVGEKIDDIIEFDAKSFAAALVGIKKEDDSSSAAVVS
jgi:fused signal recognition particle receptor